MPKIRVLLTDDHAILIAGLRALLDYYDDVDIVGEARDGAEALALVGELEPDVVLMDIAMPGMNGLEASRLIHEQHPDTKILILTQHEERQYVLALLQAGVSGYVLKQALASDLIVALRAVASGQVFLHPAVSTVLVEELQDPGESLTSREMEILGHIVRGKTNPQIAEALSLSVKTVEWHRTNLMGKLGVHNTAELVRFALHHGLVVDQN